MSTKPFVLIVDDDPDGREMLTIYLRYRGMEVVAASNAVAAVPFAVANVPTVVLMDLQMPGLTGWEATQQLRLNPHTKDTIIIAVTAQAMRADDVKALAAGCDGYVTKPYNVAELGNAITRLMADGRAGLPAIAALATSERKPTLSRTDSNADH